MTKVLLPRGFLHSSQLFTCLLTDGVSVFGDYCSNFVRYCSSRGVVRAIQKAQSYNCYVEGIVERVRHNDSKEIT